MYVQFSILSPIQGFKPISGCFSPIQRFIPISVFYPHYSVLSSFQRFIPISVSVSTTQFQRFIPTHMAWHSGIPVYIIFQKCGYFHIKTLKALSILYKKVKCYVSKSELILCEYFTFYFRQIASIDFTLHGIEFPIIFKYDRNLPWSSEDKRLHVLETGMRDCNKFETQW